VDYLISVTVECKTQPITVISILSWGVF